MSKFVKILLPLMQFTGGNASFAPGSIVEVENDVADALIEAGQASLQEAIIPEGQLTIDSCGVFNVAAKKEVNVQPAVFLVRLHGNPDHKGLYAGYYIKGSEQPFHCLDEGEYSDYFTLPENKVLIGWSSQENAEAADDLEDFRPTEHTDLYAVFGDAEQQIDNNNDNENNENN